MRNPNESFQGLSMDIMGLGINWNEVYRARAGPVPGWAWRTVPARAGHVLLISTQLRSFVGTGGVIYTNSFMNLLLPYFLVMFRVFTAREPKK